MAPNGALFRRAWPDRCTNQEQHGYIPARIAVDAVAKKYDQSDAESERSKAWYENVYGAGAEARNTVVRALRVQRTNLAAALTKLTTAQTAYEAIKDDRAVSEADKTAKHAAWVTEYAAYALVEAASDQGYAAYRALAEEADAWAVGDATKTAYVE
ncbi:MAG: hypothetical protein ACJATT_004598 [Myxococcota bacterium]